MSVCFLLCICVKLVPYVIIECHSLGKRGKPKPFLDMDVFEKAIMELQKMSHLKYQGKNQNNKRCIQLLWMVSRDLCVIAGQLEIVMVFLECAALCWYLHKLNRRSTVHTVHQPYTPFFSCFLSIITIIVFNNILIWPSFVLSSAVILIYCLQFLFSFIFGLVLVTLVLILIVHKKMTVYLPFTLFLFNTT